MAKSADDKYESMTAVVIGHTPFAAIALFMSPLPAPQSWGLLAFGVLLHVGYQFALLIAYQSGDLSSVYPVSRGAAPIIIAVISTSFLEVPLSPAQLVAVLTISVGIASLLLVKQDASPINMRSGVAALGAAGFIAGYSLVDGLGARAAGTALGFYGWLSLFNGILFACVIRIVRPGSLRRVLIRGKSKALLGGGASFIAYGLVIWAFTQAPIVLVAALRETSIVFALGIGVLVLKERINFRKLASSAVTLLGAVLLRLFP